MNQKDVLLIYLYVMHYVDWLLSSSQSTECMTYANCRLYTVDPPDDEQQACSKHVEAYY
jgi:hypothetical protein